MTEAADAGQLADRIHACLLGGAIGDALGADIEFVSLAEIRRRFPTGFGDLPRHDGVQGAITDDTQMTLFTAEGLIRAAVRYEERGICHPPSVIHHALLRWLVTQGETPRVEVDRIGLIREPRLRVRRAPGNTCLGALRSAGSYGELARNDSKGCGTIMRVAPAAFVARDRIRDMAMESSALTHGHRTGQEAAAAWALILADLSAGAGIEVAARRQTGAFGAETDRAILRALEAPRDGAAETVEALGGGWIAEEALSIALYACLCAEDLAHGLTIAVTHSGDGDSTGAIAGNALGLMFPDEARDHAWAQQVECADLIAKLSRDLALALRGRATLLITDCPGIWGSPSHAGSRPACGGPRARTRRDPRPGPCVARSAPDRAAPPHSRIVRRTENHEMSWVRQELTPSAASVILRSPGRFSLGTLSNHGIGDDEGSRRPHPGLAAACDIFHCPAASPDRWRVRSRSCDPRHRNHPAPAAF